MTAVTRLGWTGVIEVPPNKAASKLFAVREELASVFDVHESSVILSPMDTARRMRIEVYEVNPLQAAGVFTAPTLDVEQGRCVIGHDTLGKPAYWRLWRPGWGACHGFVFGTTGAGKSSLIELLMTEVRHSGLGVPWFLDPEEGLSAPAWIKGANHYAGSDEDGSIAPIRTALQALERLWIYRRHQHSKMGRTWQEPSPLWPLIFVVVDESPDVLADPECARIIKLLLRKGRKTGVALILIAQVPSLADLGGDQTTRSMAASLNVAAFRTSDRMSGTMGMPGVLPVDPVTLPSEWADGSSTAGLAYMAGGRMVRTTWVQDPYPWAQSGQPADLDEGSARAAGGDYLRAWLERHERADEAVAVVDQPVEPAANVTAIEDAAAAGSLRERLVALLTERGTATTGVLNKLAGEPGMTQVSRALRKAAERGEIHDDGHARWSANTTNQTIDEAVGED